jgi:hypothetical protein
VTDDDLAKALLERHKTQKQLDALIRTTDDIRTTFNRLVELLQGLTTTFHVNPPSLPPPTQTNELLELPSLIEKARKTTEQISELKEKLKNLEAHIS